MISWKLSTPRQNETTRSLKFNERGYFSIDLLNNRILSVIDCVLPQCQWSCICRTIQNNVLTFVHKAKLIKVFAISSLFFKGTAALWLTIIYCKPSYKAYGVYF